METTELTDRPSIDRSEELPLLLRLSPTTVVLVAVGWLTLAWTLFIAVDIFGLVDLGRVEPYGPLWRLIFNNNRAVEWTQWFMLAFGGVSAAYLAGLLHADKRVKVSRFFLLLAIGLALMLIEDAGDIRHFIGEYPVRMLGDEILGVHYRVVSDVPYFAALASVPLYAVLRYGRYAWKCTRMRLYLVLGVVLYALAAMGSAIRVLNGFYASLGAVVDALLFANRFPFPDGMSQEMAHFWLMDSVVEESVEFLGATMLVAAILAFARDAHLGQRAARR